MSVDRFFSELTWTLENVASFSLGRTANHCREQLLASVLMKRSSSSPSHDLRSLYRAYSHSLLYRDFSVVAIHDAVRTIQHTISVFSLSSSADSGSDDVVANTYRRRRRRRQPVSFDVRRHHSRVWSKQNQTSRAQHRRLRVRVVVAVVDPSVCSFAIAVAAHFISYYYSPYVFFCFVCRFASHLFRRSAVHFMDYVRSLTNREHRVFGARHNSAVSPFAHL